MGGHRRRRWPALLFPEPTYAPVSGPALRGPSAPTLSPPTLLGVTEPSRVFYFTAQLAPRCELELRADLALVPRALGASTRDGQEPRTTTRRVGSSVARGSNRFAVYTEPDCGATLTRELAASLRESRRPAVLRSLVPAAMLQPPACGGYE